MVQTTEDIQGLPSLAEFLLEMEKVDGWNLHKAEGSDVMSVMVWVNRPDYRNVRRVCHAYDLMESIRACVREVLRPNNGD